MTSVINLLTQDHRDVEELFGDFAESGDEATARAICDMLTLHTEIEERLVYPDLRRIDGSMADEAEQEHAQAKDLIRRIQAASADEMVTLMDELEAAIEHHVGEEEAEAFPKLEEHLDESRLDEMGRQAEAMKQTRQSV